jgi:hypothetical protein
MPVGFVTFDAVQKANFRGGMSLQLPRAESRVEGRTGSTYKAKDSRRALGRINASVLRVRQHGNQKQGCEEQDARDFLHGLIRLIREDFDRPIFEH